MGKRLLKVCFFLVTGILSTTQVHSAPLDFGCLKGTEGKVVLWDREWQPDNTDHDVRYRVISVEDREFPARPREAIITLQAIETAPVPTSGKGWACAHTLIPVRRYDGSGTRGWLYGAGSVFFSLKNYLKSTLYFKVY